MAIKALEVNQILDCVPRVAASRRKTSVLLIEDSEDAMLLVRYALEEYGGGQYDLEWANCLSEGLNVALRGGVDVVLLDLGLPECSGAASYAWLREAAPEVPVVVLTGDACEETELSIFANGVADYLVKDQVSGSLLVSAIQRAIQSGKRRQHPKNMTNKVSRRFHWRSKD